MRIAQRTGCQVTGVDIQAQGIAQATTYAAQRGLSDRATFRVLDGSSALPFETETVVACGLAIMQTIALRRDPEKSRAMAKQFEPVKEMIPHTNQEAREFVALSITAGICEEILYRGYLRLYISSAIAIEGMWPAALLSSLAFGLAHTYQEPKGVLRVSLLGLVFAGLYLLTGSIWLPIVLHAVIDLVSGSLGRAVIAADEAPQVQALDDT